MTKEHIDKVAQHLYQLHLLRFRVLPHPEKRMPPKLRKVEPYNLQLKSPKVMLKELVILIDPVDENPQVQRERCHFKPCIVHI